MYLKELFKKPTHTFHTKFDDEFYIDQVIGIEEITYQDWSEDLNNRKEQNDRNI